MKSDAERGNPHVHDYTVWAGVILGALAALKIIRSFSNTWSHLTRKAAAAVHLGAPSVPAAFIPGFQNRAADADIGSVSGPQAADRDQLGTVLVLSAFLVAIGAGVGFLFAYWMRANNALLGGTLALSLAGFGSGLVLWSHWLMRQTQAVEPREPVESNNNEKQAAAEEFGAGERQIYRRKLLTGLSAAVLGIFGAAALSLLRSLGKPPGPSLMPTIWKRGQRLMTEKGEAVTVNALEVGSFVTVFPEGRIGSVDGQTMLIRVREQLLNLPKDRSAWAPMGYIAYSRVCTHAGCPVGEFESDANLMLCPCHQSTFAVLQAAQPTSGPAARPLPQLPLYIDPEGTLRAAGDFSEPPGPGFWRMP